MLKIKKRIVKFLCNIIILTLFSMLGLLIGFRYIEGFNRVLQPLFYRLVGDKTIFTELVQKEKLDNPYMLSLWMMDNFDYKLDIAIHKKREYWQTPLETLNLKTGDCEDFAFFAQEMLNQMGINSQILLMQSERGGHAVCVFKWKWRYWIFDNQHLLRTPSWVKTLDDLVLHYYDSNPRYWVVL